MEKPIAEATKHPLVVVALGGHSFLREGDRGTIDEQQGRADRIAKLLMTFVGRGNHMILTHGNGPQVGSLLAQHEIAREEAPPMPLDVLVAMTEGSLGYVLQQSLLNRLGKEKVGRRVVTTITQVLVEEDDPAFREPRKFVGPVLSPADAEKKREERGWVVREDQGRGWRRVVPSPRPRHVLQHRMIGEAARQGHIIIACGGGGVPVCAESDGRIVGVEGVIDKDLTSGRLAIHVKADLLVILTSVPNVMVDFDTPEQRPLGAVTLEEVERLYDEGHFPPGSMGPKVEAVIEFLRAGGQRALITDPEHLPAAIRGRAGTHFVGEI